MIESIAIGTIVELCVENFIGPKLESLAKLFKDTYNDYMIPRREHFEEYLLRSYEKYSVINTLALKNQQKLLKDLYVPLTLVRSNNNSKCNISQQIDKFPVDFVKEYNKILITDTAGMGKSTLTKFLFLDVIENGHYGIPIYIELRRLGKERTILQEIYNQLNSLAKEFDSDLLLKLIQTGDFVFFFDGYDEIPLVDRKFVTANIQDFIAKAANNTFFMTSRPEKVLSSFGDFQDFSINQLSNVEAYELLRKIDSNGEISIRLISELKSGLGNTIQDFLKNPLLVSLLYKAYDYKHVIPLKKHIFYRNVYDAYFDTHDLSKGDSYVHDKYSKLDIDDFNKVLRYIAYKCLQLHKIEFEKDNLLGIIYEAREEYPELQFSPSDFLNDIIITVPLFCIDGCYYRWVHKSLQEYFAALFIYTDSKKQQDIILSTLYNSINLEKYINLLSLYSNIDYIGFRKNIVLPFLEDFIEFYNNNYFEQSELRREDIEFRISYMFLHKKCLIYNRDKISDLSPIIDKYFGNLYTVTINFEDKIGFAQCIHALISLFYIISGNLQNIYTVYTKNTIKKLQILKDDNMCFVDVKYGKEDKNVYLYCNYLLIKFQSLGTRYLNYEICLQEVKNIKKLINSKENKSNLIEGL